MTFEELNLDLFDYVPSDQNFYYAHCISRDFALGAGIAKTFRKKFALTKPTLTAGLVHNVSIVSNVFNLITKSHYWEKPTYQSLESSLKEMKSLILTLNGNNTNNITLVMPKIGCGLDRLSWHNVKKMIKEIFEDTDLRIVICYL